jgi:hypothetical protein
MSPSPEGPVRRVFDGYQVHPRLRPRLLSWQSANCCNLSRRIARAEQPLLLSRILRSRRCLAVFLTAMLVLYSLLSSRKR